MVALPDQASLQAGDLPWAGGEGRADQDDRLGSGSSGHELGLGGQLASKPAQLGPEKRPC